MPVSLIGIPTDRNSSYLRGAAKAPPVIRAALHCAAGNSFTEGLFDLSQPGVWEDAGDLPKEPTHAQIAGAIGNIIEQGRTVLALGGDHAVAFPLVEAHARRRAPFSIVQFDAHPDLYDEFDGNRESHACPFARIMEAGYASSLTQIGIRAATPAQHAQAARFGVRQFSPYELEQAAAALPKGDVYVSIDLDALDPAYAPGVSHREPGGLSTRDVVGLLRHIPGRVIGADVVELNPVCDVHGLTAPVAAKLVGELIALMA